MLGCLSLRFIHHIFELMQMIYGRIIYYHFLIWGQIKVGGYKIRRQMGS